MLVNFNVHAQIYRWRERRIAYVCTHAYRHVSVRRLQGHRLAASSLVFAAAAAAAAALREARPAVINDSGPNVRANARKGPRRWITHIHRHDVHNLTCRVLLLFFFVFCVRALPPNSFRCSSLLFACGGSTVPNEVGWEHDYGPH